MSRSILRRQRLQTYIVRNGKHPAVIDVPPGTDLSQYDDVRRCGLPERVQMWAGSFSPVGAPKDFWVLLLGAFLLVFILARLGFVVAGVL